MNTKQLFISIEKKLNESTLSKHQALDIADGLFLLIPTNNELEKNQLHVLKSKFLEILDRSSILDLVQSQMNYAIKIADSPGELLYEEIVGWIRELHRRDYVESLEQLAIERLENHFFPKEKWEIYDIKM